MATIHDDLTTDSVLGTSSADVIYGGTSASPLVGTGDDSLNGGNGYDTIYGGDGNDTLSGGDTSSHVRDSLFGGAGDDTYLINEYAFDTSTDYVTEYADEGIDTVISDMSFTLGDNIENLVIFSNPSNPLSSQGVGNALANHIVGNDYVNALTGNDGNDTLEGGGGNDTLNGDIGDDNLDGGDGNDMLAGGTGADTMSGGTGNDTYYVDVAQDVIDESGGAGIDTVYSSVSWTLAAEFEYLRLQGDVALDGIGNASDNSIRGTIAANYLWGGDGNDALTGYGGGDTLDGGAGIDTLYYTTYTTGIAINLSTGVGPDIFYSIENVWTGTGNDTITGNDDDNYLNGGDDGRDRLVGGAGNDTLSAGVGGDTLIGGTGDDEYRVHNAAAVNSTLTELAGEGTDSVWSWVSWTLGANIEILELGDNYNAPNGVGNALDNIILGSNADNSLSGGDGNDVLYGNGWRDTLVGDAGSDTLYGGTYDDTYVVDADDTTIEYAGEGNDIVLSSVTWTLSDHIENLTLTGVDAVNGTGSAQANTLLGNTAANSLDGAGGNDTLSGVGGGDTLNGGDGNDILFVDAGGGGTFIGGAGNDILSYLGVGVAITVDLGTGVGTGANSILEIEQVTGDIGNDTLTGDSGDNLLLGGGGADSLLGGDGNDTLTGDAGNDRTFGGAGNDLHVIASVNDRAFENPGEGTDTIEAPVSWTLGGNIENLVLTGIAALSGTGNSANNIITGNSADNSLDGGSGADTLLGGAGNDFYIVDDSNDVITENAGEGSDAVQSSASWTMTDNLETLALTGIAVINGTGNLLANTLTGNSAANALDGGAGNDTLFASAGGDTLDGGADSDIVSYADAVAGVTVDLATGIGTDTYLNIEGAIGGSGNDFLNGNADANLLVGGSGDDSLVGNTGNDTLQGDAGIDTSAGGAGDDVHIVDSADDVVSERPGEGTDTLQSAVTRTLGSNFENLVLSGASNSNGTGNALNNVISGSAGNNLLLGGGGDDSISGGTGNDTLQGDSGLDWLAGGAGDDFYVLSGAYSDSITEHANEGVDSVQSALSWTLGDNIENLVFTGTGNTHGTGNASANTLTGTSGNNKLLGNDGNDTLFGGDGNDTLNGGNGSDAMSGGNGDDVYFVSSGWGDVVIETAGGGFDTVHSRDYYHSLADNVENLVLDASNIQGEGNSLDNLISADSGRQTLTGGGGTDTLAGGAGDDEYWIDSSDDVVIELAGGGFDILHTSASLTLFSGIERLHLIDYNVTATGTAGDDVIIAEGQANLVSGEGGDDYLTASGVSSTLAGGAGNDTYDVLSSDSVLQEAADEGIDTVITLGLDWTLAENIENLVLDGYAAYIDGTGNAGNNVLTGTAYGNNRLDGAAGDDTLIGGDGSDSYLVDSSGDVVIESSDGLIGGHDTVSSSVSFTLAAGCEDLLALGSNSITLNGNALNNRIDGNDADNTIRGGNGSDVIHGFAGDDVLFGGDGYEEIYGGAGNDTLVSGAGDGYLSGDEGADVFVLSALPDHVIDWTVIADFTHDLPGEIIRLKPATFTSLAPGALSAGQFVYGYQAADSDDFVIYHQGSGYLYYDADGSGIGEAIIFAVLDNQSQLDAADFRIA